MSFVPSAPNAAWTPPLDINDEVPSCLIRETLEQEEHAFDEELKLMIDKDITNPLGNLDVHEEEEEEEGMPPLTQRMT